MISAGSKPLNTNVYADGSPLFFGDAGVVEDVEDKDCGVFAPVAIRGALP